MITSLERVTGGLRRWHRRLFRRTDDQRIRSRVESLRSSPMFGDMSGRHLVAVAEAMHERHYRRDEYVYYEGDPGIGLYLICEGRVWLTGRDEEGHEIDIAELREGDIFGSLSIFEDLRRAESAQSRADTILLGLFRPDLNVVANRSPSAGISVYRAVARHIGGRYASLLGYVEDTCGRTQTIKILADMVQEQKA